MSSLLGSHYVPKRGDVIWINFDPQLGREQAKRRPALVLSPEAYNRKVRLALVCPITSQIKGYSWEVTIPSGLPVKGAILSDQVKSLDWKARNAEYLCQVPQAVFKQVLAKLSTLL